MAIPTTQLELSNINVKELTLEETYIFFGEFNAVLLRDFLLKYGNWTRKDIGRITLGELESIANQIGDQLKTALAPKDTAAA